MSVELKQRLIKSLNDVSDDNIEFLIFFVEKYIKNNNNNGNEKRPIGLFKGQNLYNHDWDIDEDNDEIARMFGENA